MADLLELLLNLVFGLLELLVELPFGGSYVSGGWRFVLPFMISVWLVVLIECLGSNNRAAEMLSGPIVLAGLASGIIWEVRYNRKP